MEDGRAPRLSITLEREREREREGGQDGGERVGWGIERRGRGDCEEGG